MRLKLLSCEVFAREIAALLKESKHEISVQFFSKGLHEIGCTMMRQRLQDAITFTSPDEFEAIILAYGLCGFGTIGLRAGKIPLVLPRAHDCITILLGGRGRHETYSADHPGAYFRSSGWLERRSNPPKIKSNSISEKNSLNQQPAELAAKYGFDSGNYLAGILCDWTRHYDRLTFIETGIEPDGRFERQSKVEARDHGWQFEKVRGDLRLLRKLLSGQWSEEDFLIVPPGDEVRPTYNQDLIRSGPAHTP